MCRSQITPKEKKLKLKLFSLKKVNTFFFKCSQNSKHVGFARVGHIALLGICLAPAQYHTPKNNKHKFKDLK